MIDFNNLTDNHLKKDFRIKVIGRYYPSEIGQCMRKAYYSFINPKETDIELIKIFEAGNLVHDFVSKIFESEKNPEIELIEKETPFELLIDDFIISGRIDNLILLKLENRKVLVEVKSTKALGLLEEPKKEHIMQLQLYLGAKNIPDGVMIYIEKNTLKSKTFTVTYNSELYEQIINRCRKLHNHLKNSSSPEPEARLIEENNWMCRYCNYREECYKEIPENELGNFHKK